MSQGEPIPLREAGPLAESLRHALEPYCERIEVAGSIRRHRPLVNDIELVAIPRIDHDAAQGLFDVGPVSLEAHDRLEEAIVKLRKGGLLDLRAIETHRASGDVDLLRKDGPRYKALVYGGLPVDLFIVRPPASWGVVFALRTGPGDWNIKLVTEAARRFRRVREGQVVDIRDQVIPTPEEEDFFAAIYQPWVPPHERRPAMVTIP